MEYLKFTFTFERGFTKTFTQEVDEENREEIIDLMDKINDIADYKTLTLRNNTESISVPLRNVVAVEVERMFNLK